jgi:hypothetical protein
MMYKQTQVYGHKYITFIQNFYVNIKGERSVTLLSQSACVKFVLILTEAVLMHL